MFTCTICDKNFIADHHDSTYTTPCGHVFHCECIMTWLKRSQKCAFCRLPISEDNLIKLFLQFDPLVQLSWDPTIDREIKGLKMKVQYLEDILSVSLRNENLQIKLEDIKHALIHKNRTIGLLNNEVETQKINNSEIAADINLLRVKLDASKVEQTKLRAETSVLKSKIKSQNHEIYNLQSVNSSTINQLKLELATLKSETAKERERCCNTEINLDQPSTSKSQQKAP